MTIDPFRLDPLSLAQLAIATWLTELVVAQKFAEALQMQSSLVIDGIAGSPYRPGSRRAA
jgi:hypothetical protein